MALSPNDAKACICAILPAVSGPRLLMGGDRVVSGKALEARGSLDGWQEDTGDDGEREHRKMRAALNAQECEPIFMSVCMSMFLFILLRGLGGLGPRPPRGPSGKPRTSAQLSGFRTPRFPSAGGCVLFPTSHFYKPPGVTLHNLRKGRGKLGK